MPNKIFAAQELDFGDRGRLLLFPAHSIKYTEKTDPYYNSQVQLSAEGLHRNVFLVDKTGRPIWRIADYEHPLPDGFVDIHRGESDDKAIGGTFRGWIMEIDLADGSLKIFDRTK